MWEQDNIAINVEKELERIEKHLQFINSGQAM